MKNLRISLLNTSSILQASNLLSLILFFAFGLSFGILLNVISSFKFRFNEFSLTTTADEVACSLQPPMPMPMGLEDFIHPSKIMHEMTDQQLVWRASMVPKVPLDRLIIPKVAFMFLTRGPVLMSPLWERFFKGHNGLFTIYVHTSDSSSNWTAEPNNSVFHGRKIPSKEVQWGKVNMIEAERRLLANALLDFSNQRFVLLSESCIPLFNFSTVYSYLINANKSFVESYDLIGPVGRRRYNRKMYPTIKLQEWRKGSQWFEMDRDLALEVISDMIYFPTFQNYCKSPCCADEHYLPTFITKKFGARNSRRTLTFVDWSKGGPHPSRYTRNDITTQFLEKLRGANHCEYNARKKPNMSLVC